ncbi:steroid receptor seven-up-like [Haematobia irritans]|uniref:steroid receptor seven-up-like n=1 Tax=Haematobia irritans TaxID=7368 RepID=UPI003F50C83A
MMVVKEHLDELNRLECESQQQSAAALHLATFMKTVAGVEAVTQNACLSQIKENLVPNGTTQQQSEMEKLPVPLSTSSSTASTGIVHSATSAFSTCAPSSKQMTSQQDDLLTALYNSANNAANNSSGLGNSLNSQNLNLSNSPVNSSHTNQNVATSSASGSGNTLTSNPAYMSPSQQHSQQQTQQKQQAAAAAAATAAMFYQTPPRSAFGSAFDMFHHSTPFGVSHAAAAAAAAAHSSTGASFGSPSYRYSPYSYGSRWQL